MCRKPLLAFDFDGTLTPIVSRPEQAFASKAVALRLHALSQLLPVAIVTGRTIEDARERLGFVPTYLIGNHGAQDENDPVKTAFLCEGLNPLREALQTPGGTCCGGRSCGRQGVIYCFALPVVTKACTGSDFDSQPAGAIGQFD